MKIIRYRLVLLAFLYSVVLLFSIILFINNFIICKIDMQALFVLLVLVSIALVIFLIRQYVIHKLAKLIIENKIMHITVAEAKEVSTDVISNTLPIGSLEVFISCFGVLLGSRVIKYNIDGIKLKEVEIGGDFISLVYGKDKKSNNIRLLHGVIEKPELLNVIERFRHETGITPIIAGKRRT